MSSNIESGVQLYKRIRNSSSPSELHYPLFPDGILTNESIEILGDTKASNSLILDFIIRSILPRELDGNESNVVLINTEHNITIPVLINAIQHVTKRSKFDENLVEGCLGRLTILNCYNNDQFRFTFMELDDLLLKNRDVNVVVIDSLFSYYWMEKPNLGVISYQKYCSNVLDDLLKSIEFEIVLIYKSIKAEIYGQIKGFKKNNTIDISCLSEDKYQLDIYEDGVPKNGKLVQIKGFVQY